MMTPAVTIDNTTEWRGATSRFSSIWISDVDNAYWGRLPDLAIISQNFLRKALSGMIRVLFSSILFELYLFLLIYIQRG